MGRNKNVVLIILVIIVCLRIKLKDEKEKKEKCDEKDNLIYRQEEVLINYEKWVDVFLNKGSIASWIKKKNYYKIAIYGLGRLGKQLYEELNNSGVDIAYVIDQKYSLEHRSYNCTDCFHPEDKLPEVDLIIVAVPSEAQEIIIKLREKMSCEIKSMNDIFFVI